MLSQNEKEIFLLYYSGHGNGRGEFIMDDRPNVTFEEVVLCPPHNAYVLNALKLEAVIHQSVLIMRLLKFNY
eukprot:2208636-Pyramimonas_sp.AAC.1